MPGKPILSVLLTTHTGADSFESLLDTLLSFRLGNVEIIVINDGVGRSHARAIQLLMDMYPTDLARYYIHEKEHGRSRCLNEALVRSSGTLIWAPLKANRLNKSLMINSAKKMIDDPAALWVLDRSLPGDMQGWIREAEEGTLPNDNRFVFNRNFAPPSEFYFNQEIHDKPAAELAFRILEKKSYQTTDSFFVIDRTPVPPPNPVEVQEYYLSFLRRSVETGQRKLLIDKIKNFDASKTESESDPTQIDRARSLTDKDPRLALNLINQYLKLQPHHYEALKLKITLLEKLRRHVEASELKHTLQKRQSSSSEKSPDQKKSIIFGESSTTKKSGLRHHIKLSIIIPTTGDCKPILEQCLVRLHELFSPADTEIIIIDNASIDDTFDYLNQLQSEYFLNLKVITNNTNKGFGASVNQGIKASFGSYLLIMHNDLLLKQGTAREMIRLLDEHPNLGVIGPVLDDCNLPDQIAGSSLLEKSSGDFVKVKALDSCCLMIRSSLDIRFDENYGAAFYEDVDFCRQISESGHSPAIAVSAKAEHHNGAATDAMGLKLEPEFRWENAEYFESKWYPDKKLKFPDKSRKNILEQLLQIPAPVNPANPPGYWLDHVNSFFTDEFKTSILKSKLSRKELIGLIRILLIADKRELLRTMEERLNGREIPVKLLKELVRFYYKRNIYSRCNKYLDLPEAKGPYFDLHRLRIQVAEKEMDETVELLTRLMKKFPCHPDLYRLAGDIHKIGDNEEEAKSFYALADQLDVKNGKKKEGEFEIKY